MSNQGVNKVVVIGRLGNDPEMKYTANGKAICNVSVATSEKWKKDGQDHESTEWHRIVMFGRLGEIANEYLRKGSQAYFEGKLNTSKYEKDGQTHYSTSIIANQMQMLDSKGQREQAGHSSTSSQAPVDYPKKQTDDGIEYDDIPF